jgi:5,10-methylene-tetrahydrofolate dehydrogenase/methenyl tetrahydrofolate cyclohydrolase
MTRAVMIFGRLAACIIAIALTACCAKKEDKPEVKTVKQAETNAAQTYIDSKKKSIDKAKESMEKSNSAQQEQLKTLEDIK